MKELNKYISNIKPSIIRAFSEKQNTLMLSLGENQASPPLILRLMAFFKSHTNYICGKGFLPLRKEISASLNNNYSEEEILITAGSSNALDLTLRTLLNPSDEVIVFLPAYPAYKPLIELCGAKTVFYTLKESNNYEPDISELECLITPKTKLIIINYPHNPTGAILDEVKAKALIDLVIEKDLYLISDEIYLNFAYFNNVKSLALYKEAKHNLIVISGVSKSFSLTGARIGFALGPKEIIDKMLLLFQYSMISVSSYSAYLAYYCYRWRNKLLKRSKKAYLKKRNYVLKSLNKLAVSYYLPQGAFYFWVYVDNSLEYAQKLLDNGIALTPSKAFNENDNKHLRLSYSTKLKTLKKAFKKWQNIVI